MAQPTPYDRQFSFQNFQATQPTTPLPGDEVDGELNSVKVTLDQTLVNLAKIQRDDGALKNGIVTNESLSPSLSIGFTFRGVWAAGVNYLLSDGVSVGSIFYKAKVSHLSSAETNPATDPNTWDVIADITPIAISPDSVYTAALQAGAVTEAKLGSQAVATAKLADGAVATAKLADGAVATAKLADGAVTEAKLGSQAVATAKLADGAVATAKIGDGAVATAKLADGALSADSTGRAKMAPSFVTASHLADAAFATGFPVNVSLSASVNANALTIDLLDASGAALSATSPAKLPFRSATPGSGVSVGRTVTAATTLVISSGSTMGFANSTAGRIWVVAFDDAGTARLGAINCCSGVDIFPLGQMGIASSTAEGGAGAADSAHVFYTGTAVTSKAYTVLGYMEWSAGLTTAGTWAIVPTAVEIFKPGMKLPGDVVQPKFGKFSTYQSNNSLFIPIDDTIPQNTEGAAAVTISLAATSAANVIAARSKLNLGNNTAGSTVSGSICRSDQSDALDAGSLNIVSANGWGVISLEARVLAASTAAVTWTARFGAPTGAVTAFLNGSTARFFGTAQNSTLLLEEIVA